MPEDKNWPERVEVECITFKADGLPHTGIRVSADRELTREELAFFLRRCAGDVETRPHIVEQRVFAKA